MLDHFHFEYKLLVVDWQKAADIIRKAWEKKRHGNADNIVDASKTIMKNEQDFWKKKGVVFNIPSEIGLE